MFSLTSIVSFVLVLGILVFVHEFGHYIIARWCGVQVETFSLGFGPKIFSRQWGPTEYCVSAIPLGGFVRLLGDDPNEEVAPEDAARSFLAQKVSKRIAIVIAGPVFNLLLAFFIFSGVFMGGISRLTADVGEVQADSPAGQGGMKPGDRILSIEGQAITEWETIREVLQKEGGRSLQFVVEREGRQVDLSITPGRKEVKDLLGDPKVVWLIGIIPSGDSFTMRYNPIRALTLGAEKTSEVIGLTVLGIVRMIQGRIASDNIGGPILIAKLAGDSAERGFTSVAFFTALISINLGILNILPIPVLDGGHLLFFTIEAILGRPLSLKKREIAQQVGLFLIVSLMVFAFYNDIMRFLIKPE
ncbi:MAG: RIP metalloprotease RseP [Nitrospiria bacterium]